MPKGWKPRCLADLVTFRNGMNFTQSSRGQSVKVVGVGDFKDREVLSDFSQTVSVVLNGNVNQDDLLLDDDLLFVRSNGNKALVGRCVLVKDIAEPISFSGFTIRARISSGDVDPSYLSKLVRSPMFKQHLHRWGGGSSISNLSQDSMSQFSFDLPPLPEQRRIAAILRTWDSALNKTDALIGRSNQRHLALTYSLVFGGRRLTRFKQSNKRSRYQWFALPSEWNCHSIWELAEEVSERNGGSADVEVLSCSKHEGFVKSLDYFKKQVFSADLTGYKKI